MGSAISKDSAISIATFISAPIISYSMIGNGLSTDERISIVGATTFLLAIYIGAVPAISSTITMITSGIVSSAFVKATSIEDKIGFPGFPMMAD